MMSWWDDSTQSSNMRRIGTSTLGFVGFFGELLVRLDVVNDICGVAGYMSRLSFPAQAQGSFGASSLAFMSAIITSVTVCEWFRVPNNNETQFPKDGNGR